MQTQKGEEPIFTWVRKDGFHQEYYDDSVLVEQIRAEIGEIGWKEARKKLLAAHLERPEEVGALFDTIKRINKTA